MKRNETSKIQVLPASRADHLPFDPELLSRFGALLLDEETPPASLMERETEWRPQRLTDEMLETHFSSVPGLFQQIILENGCSIWKISQGGKPGDALHYDFLDNFTNEQHWNLIAACRINTVAKHGTFLKLLSRVYWSYRIYSEEYIQPGTLQQHKARLKVLAKRAKELRLLIEAEPFLDDLLPQDSLILMLPRKSGSYPSQGEQTASFQDILRNIERQAADFSKDETLLKQLRTYRLLNCFELDDFKTAERQYIWEPIFDYWAKENQKLGFSENGPIMEILSIVHNVFGIDPPRGASVRQAMNDYKGKARSPKTKSGHAKKTQK
jgi:hypothetical protein